MRACSHCHTGKRTQTPDGGSAVSEARTVARHNLVDKSVYRRLLSHAFTDVYVAKRQDEFEKLANSAASDDAAAQCAVGFCYSRGLCCNKDVKTGADWYQRAAARGNVTAQFNLALCLFAGEGVEINERKAIELLRRAAQAHDRNAMLALPLTILQENLDIQQSLSAHVWRCIWISDSALAWLL